MKTVKDITKDMFNLLKDEFSYTSFMQAPKIEKVVVSAGVGKFHSDKNKLALVQDRLAKITGQKPKVNKAKISVAAFKLRAGSTIGYQVTLRGGIAYNFLDKLINIALPRTRDFRGLELSSIDGMGNMNIGIKEHTIFPETSDEDLNDVFGLGVTIVTTAKTRDEAKSFLLNIGMPLKKDK